MKPPKYNPLKMGNKIDADRYAKKLKSYYERQNIQHSKQNP